MADEFDNYGITMYQNPIYTNSNAIKTINDTILSLPRLNDIKYPAHFNYEGQPYVKIDETNSTVQYVISDKSVNVNKLFNYVTDLYTGITDETVRNEIIDFSIYSSFFPKSHFADIKKSLNIPVVKSRNKPLSKLDKTFKVVERINNINIYRLLNKEFDRNNSMFVKALFDASDKYNMSVLDIINNTYGIEDIYNEPILKSDSSGVGVKLIYNPEEKGLSIYESNTIDDNNPTTIGDVIKLLNDTIKFKDVLSELNDEYKNKLIYATSALGKTTIANTTKNVIDSDNLKLQVIFEDYSNFKMERNEKVQAFIYRVSGKVDTISLNTKVFNKIKEKLNQGYTVLTATPAFMRNADYVFTTDMNNERLLSRFKTIEEVESVLAKESEAIAKSGKSVKYVTNLEDVLVKKPEAEQPKSQTEINIYAGTNENAELSNFAVRPFEDKGEWEGLTFKTVEGAFQAAKMQYVNSSSLFDEVGLNQKGELFLDKFQDATGAEARKLGKTIDGLNVKEWDKNSSRIMKELILESFKQNPDALAKLLATGNATLTHKYEGLEQDNGRFSKILMEVRDELRGTTQQDTNDYETGNGFNSDNCLT